MFGSMKIDLSGYLTDVQINGSSIVSDGVANVSIANNNALGLVKTSNTYGVGVFSSDGVMYLKSPSEANIKAGYGGNAIQPPQQHISTFYGLAKSAGDTTQFQSSNAVGNYTEEAKDAIQNMLGITDKYTSKEWIAESETELVTNAHNIGDLFYIGGTLYKVIADLNAGDVINVGVNVEVVNVNDVLNDYATKEDIENNVSIVEKSVSGAIASFNDGMDNMPLKSLTVDIEPVQDLHGQDSPYPAGGGKNKINAPDVTLSGNGYVFNLTGLSIPAGQYTLSFVTTATSNISFAVTGPDDDDYINTTVTNPFTFTVSGVITGIRAYGTAGTYSNIQLESGSSKTAYAPYSNICPISGWTGVTVNATGKNLIDGYNTYSGGGYNKSVGTVLNLSPNDTHPTINGNTITIEIQSNWGGVTWGTAQLASGTYTINIDLTATNNSRLSIYTVDGETNAVKTSYASTSNSAFTRQVSIDNGDYIVVVESVSVAGTITIKNFQIELGSTAADYEPYQGGTYSVNWQTEAGTVYGGTLDVLSGVLTVDMAMVDLGTLNWSTSSGYFLTTGLDDLIKRPLTASEVPNVLCDRYRAIEWSKDDDKSVAVKHTRLTGGSNLWIKDTDYTDAATFKTAMSGVQLVYELATPITYQLTPHEVNSLLGVNNIWADTGNTSCEYFSQVDEDLTDYIDINLKSYAKKSELPTIPVSDVQINGSSIITDGVANVPISSNTGTLGLVKTDTSYGLNVYTSGLIRIWGASSAEIKGGTNQNKPLIPERQHESTFYGLAKASGDTTQSASSNTVGTYTDEAKTAIKQMLGVKDNYDSFIVDVDGTDVTITGQSSYRYNCGELYSLTVTPPESGTIDFRFTSGSTPTVLTLPQTVKMPEWWVEVEANTIYEMCITDGVYCGVMTWAI